MLEEHALKLLSFMLSCFQLMSVNRKKSIHSMSATLTACLALAFQNFSCASFSKFVKRFSKASLRVGVLELSSTNLTRQVSLNSSALAPLECVWCKHTLECVTLNATHSLATLLCAQASHECHVVCVSR